MVAFFITVPFEQNKNFGGGLRWYRYSSKSIFSLVSPPSPDRRALLGPAHALRTQLATIKAVVDSGQAAVDATHDETLVQLELLERGLFGEDKRGYTAAWLDIDGRVYSVRFIFLLVSFGIPVALGGAA